MQPLRGCGHFKAVDEIPHNRWIQSVTSAAILLPGKSSGRLSLKSAWHPNATSVTSNTICSVERHPFPHQVTDMAATRSGTPHSGRQITAFLKQYFQNCRTGRQGPIAWPPRSPDLTTLTYLWGRMKSLVYAVKSNAMTELLNCKMDASVYIKQR
jgi:hypothetical protein